MVDIKLRLLDEKFKKDMAALEGVLPDLLEKSFGLAAEYVRGRVQKEYLRGPRPERLGVRSARLINSIQSSTEREGDDTRAFVGSNALSTGGFNYPGYWEFDGSKHGGPRPFLAPAVEEDSEKWIGVWLRDLKRRVEAWLSARAS